MKQKLNELESIICLKNKSLNIGGRLEGFLFSSEVFVSLLNLLSELKKEEEKVRDVKKTSLLEDFRGDLLKIFLNTYNNHFIATPENKRDRIDLSNLTRVGVYNDNNDLIVIFNDIDAFIYSNDYSWRVKNE